MFEIDDVQKVRSLPIELWPVADRAAWQAARQPRERLRRGGAASHLKAITFADLGRRYGYFLDFLVRSGTLALEAPPAAQVTPANVEGFLTELRSRVGSVTQHGTIYKLRRAAKLLDPTCDLDWLMEIETDLALVMQPRSKADQLVLAERLVEAGLTLVEAAILSSGMSETAKARQVRNGLMIAILALHPIRLKNFASLEIDRNFIETDGAWWIALKASETKEKRPDEREVDAMILPALRVYLERHRPVLLRSETNALWISSNRGEALSYGGMEAAIAEATRSTVGIGLGAHMFRTAAASSAAIHVGDNPHLGSALLHHRDRRITNKHYNFASSLSSSEKLGNLIRKGLD
ncbi:tyrosine-type recombinase/integrase [Bradyrhizobium septentrionale]|uniref:tyrosine-type recombinase/integrase n=1 Tax=Bradyrhizobium septentrionale TaxID=1404411 RepID=UPI001CD31D92|nr:tyrosine-type recombinase/integrase [Bradyrhizobium septentrionale]UGY22899.1 tyrosine-type recombinase/integrase [Bradyrhizobium septentrionale]